MSAGQAKESAAFPDEISKILISRYRLSSDDVVKITEAVKGMHLNFSDAAVHIGVVTAKEVEEAILSMREPAETVEKGVVEGALLRHVPGRSVVLRHGEQVKPGANLILAHDQNHPRSEQLRALRTALLLLNDPGNQANVLALLSPCAAEGRTQLAAELAIAFSQLGRRTLLIDGDLRRPKQHILFAARNDLGLGQALSQSRQPLMNPVEGLPFLWLLPAGTKVSNPLELLSDGHFEKLLSNWRRQYEFIIIDTPPVTEFSDGLAVATISGRVVVLSRAAMTTHNAMREMLRRLASTQSRILGAVVNQF
jgi:receptor protein-tyrosine kinase